MNIRLLSVILLLFATPCYSAVNFDGVDDYIGGTINTWDTTNDAFTLSLWVKPDTTSSGVRCIFRDNNTDAWGIYHTADNNIKYYDGSVFSSGVSVTPGNWYHIVLIQYDGVSSAADFWINGVEVATAVSGNQLDASTTARLGGDTFGQFFDGDITEVYIYNTAISDESVLRHYNSRKKRIGLQTHSLNGVFYLPMDEVPFGNSADSFTFRDMKSGNNFTGDNGGNNSGLIGSGENLLNYPQ